MKNEDKLTEETKKDIKIARKQIKEGKGLTTKKIMDRSNK